MAPDYEYIYHNLGEIFRVMSTLDIFVEKGIKIGEEKGREKTARNLVRISSLSDEQIATATDLSIDHVARIRKEVEGGE